jgi:hypothetical protein
MDNISESEFIVTCDWFECECECECEEDPFDGRDVGVVEQMRT